MTSLPWSPEITRSRNGGGAFGLAVLGALPFGFFVLIRLDDFDLAFLDDFFLSIETFGSLRVASFTLDFERVTALVFVFCVTFEERLDDLAFECVVFL